MRDAAGVGSVQRGHSMWISSLSWSFVRDFIEIHVRSGFSAILNGEMVISWISRGPSMISGPVALPP